MKATSVLLLCLLGGLPAVAQGQAPAQPEAPATDAIAPNIPGVVAGGTIVKLIKDKLEGTEGAITLPDGSLIFTEQNADRLVKIDSKDNISIFLEKTGRSIGLAWDSRGRLISTQTRPAGQTKVGVLYPRGSEAVLAEGFEGKPFSSLNDLVIDKRDGIYFTDLGPNAAQPGSDAPGAASAVYYLPAGGKLIRVIDNIAGANGIQLSRDEKTLYVNNRSEYILAFDVQPDGTLGNRRNFAKYQEGIMGADGLAIDSDGRLYTATAAGVQIFSLQGAYLGSIPVRGQSVAFAGADKKTFYIVGRGAAFKVQMQVQGFKGRAK